jgi:tetratricopeptide (TPR) repeat protein/CHAT domain-containing protein
MQNSNLLVLEVLKEEKTLAMSLFQQKDLASTLRHYSQCPVSFVEIDRLCQAVFSLLSKADRKGVLDPGAIKNLKKTGQLLWDHLLTKSVKNRLKNVQDADLILSIDEGLINIPWELLYNGSTFLCLEFNLGRLIRTKEESGLVQYRSCPEILKMLVLANPNNDLKSAYLEGLNIRNQFDHKRRNVLIDFKSTHIDKLYLKKNFCDYDIVHFAGHCEYDPGSPKNTGWLLSDGRFATADILAMASSVSLPALVFSNACYSARSSADLVESDYHEKNYSLASAFLFSGVRHYIGTIRRMEDPASAAFSKEFYTQLIRGRSIGECVRLSRLSLIKEHGITAIPWASYILYGDPNFVLFRKESKPKETIFKKGFLAYKKRLTPVLLALAALFMGIFVFLWVPSLKPSANFLFSRSKRLFLEGNNQKAILLGERLIKKDPGFLAIYSLLGDTYRRLGQIEQALKYYFDYALLAENKARKADLVSAYIGIGWTYHLSGEYPKAIDFYNKALDLSRQNQDKLNQADVLGKIAVWHIDKGDYDLALGLLTKSAEINRQNQHIYKHKYNLACDYFNLGLLFCDKDDFPAAKEFYDKSFILFNQLKLRHELSDYYFNIGEIHNFQKEYHKALNCYNKGLKIDLEQGHLVNIAGDYNMIGELYLETENLTEAERLFNQALDICADIKAPLEKGQAYYNLGMLYKKKHQKNKAKQYLRLAQEIYSRVELPEYERIKKEFLELDSQE